MVTNNSCNYGTLTQHDTLVAGANNAITSVSPGSTAGVPLVSNGVGFDPSFSVASVPGGGTGLSTVNGVLSGNGGTTLNATSVVQYSVICGGATNLLTSISPGSTAGVPLVSNGSSGYPSFSSASVPGGGTGAATLTGLLTGNGTSAITGTAITQYSVLTAGSSNAPNSVAPSSTSGVALVSNGATSQPSFTTVSVGGGGTGVTTVTGVLSGNGGTTLSASAVTQHSVIVGGATNLLTSVAPSSTSGIALVSGGSSANPSFTTVAIAGGGTNATSFSTSTGIVSYNGTSLVSSTTLKVNSSNYMTNSSQPLLASYNSTAPTAVTGSGTTYTVIFDTATVNNSSSFSTSTSIFTAPVTGNFLITGVIGIASVSTSNTSGNVTIVSTQRSYICGQGNYGAMKDANNNFSLPFQKILPMTSGDLLYITLTVGGSGTNNVGIHSQSTSPLTWLDIVLLS